MLGRGSNGNISEWDSKEESAKRIHCRDAATHILDLELASESVTPSSLYYKGKLSRELHYLERKAVQY